MKHDKAIMKRNLQYIFSKKSKTPKNILKKQCTNEVDLLKGTKRKYYLNLITTEVAGSKSFKKSC